MRIRCVEKMNFKSTRMSYSPRPMFRLPIASPIYVNHFKSCSPNTTAYAEGDQIQKMLYLHNSSKNFVQEVQHIQTALVVSLKQTQLLDTSNFLQLNYSNAISFINYV